MDTSTTHDPYQALRSRDFRLLLTGNLLANLAGQMLVLAVGWEMYERTHSALALGFIGLAQLLPVLLLALVSGSVADRHDRKVIVSLSQVAMALAALGLAALSYWQGSLLAVYGCLLLRGLGSSFGDPAARALPAQILPEETFENAVTWRNSVWHLAAIAGPALGGLIIAAWHTTVPIYLCNVVAALVFAVLVLRVRARRAPGRDLAPAAGERGLRSLSEGIGFLRRTPVILAAITLDLFAVLFGGAVVLLPVFAKDILGVGPSGLGWLQAAPSIGALAVALLLAHRPPLQRAGRTLLVAVAGFGLATIVFGISRSFWLSIGMLLLLGGLDSVSVVVRSTLILTRVPDQMRGRVAAIEAVFIGSSNQLGGFESGLTAQLFGPILAVVGGGFGTILVVLLIAVCWPQLRRLRTLRDGTALGTGAISETTAT